MNNNNLLYQVLDVRYWYFLLYSILISFFSILFLFYVESLEVDFFFLIGIIIIASLPLGVFSWLLNKIHNENEKYISIGFSGLLMIPISGLGGLMVFWLTGGKAVFSFALASGAFLWAIRGYLNSYFNTMKSGGVEILTTITCGIIAGLLFYISFEKVPRRFMGEFPLNVAVAYCIYLVFLSFSIMLPELKKHKKAITICFFVLFTALLFDIIYDKGWIALTSSITKIL